MFYHLFVDSTNCSGFHKYCCGFCKFAYFWSDFKRYNYLVISLWTPKQHIRSKKSNKTATPRQNWFWPVAESDYTAEYAQFGLVIDFDNSEISETQANIIKTICSHSKHRRRRTWFSSPRGNNSQNPIGQNQNYSGSTPKHERQFTQKQSTSETTTDSSGIDYTETLETHLKHTHCERRDYERET